MIHDANTQRYPTEKISTTPTTTLEGIVVTHVQEPSLVSRLDEEELDHNLSPHQFSEVSLGLNGSTISAAEKSFAGKREDYIYVSFLLSTSGSSK